MRVFPAERVNPSKGAGFGAGDRIRTGDIDLGKVALYQLSYSRAGKVSTISSPCVLRLSIRL